MDSSISLNFTFRDRLFILSHSTNLKFILYYCILLYSFLSTTSSFYVKGQVFSAIKSLLRFCSRDEQVFKTTLLSADMPEAWRQLHFLGHVLKCGTQSEVSRHIRLQEERKRYPRWIRSIKDWPSQHKAVSYWTIAGTYSFWFLRTYLIRFKSFLAIWIMALVFGIFFVSRSKAIKSAGSCRTAIHILTFAHQCTCLASSHASF